MKEMDRIEKLIRIHRKRKRKKRLIVSFIAILTLFTAGTALYLTRDIWLKPTSEEVSATTADSLAEPSLTEALSETQPESKEVQITVSLMGDCTLGTDENFAYDTSLNAYFLYQGADYFFENVRSILEADDLSIINMEGPLTESTARNGEL